MGLYDEEILDTDAMSLINYAWYQGFARVQTDWKAIGDRGVNLLDRLLLLDPYLKARRTMKEEMTDYQLQNNIFILITKDKSSETKTTSNKSK